MKRNSELFRLLLLHVRDEVAPEGLDTFTEKERGFHAALLVDEGYVDGSAMRDEKGQWLGAAMNCLTERGEHLLTELEAKNQHSPNVAKQSGKQLSVFISHSSQDGELSEALIELLRGAIDLRAQEIRCTSVDGYRLTAGAPTSETLLREVRDAKTFIGLITPASMASAYVLFELGARWGRELHFAPLLAKGADASFLKGPLSGFNALKCDSEAQMHQFLGELANELGKPLANPSSYSKKLHKIVSLSKAKLLASPKPPTSPNRTNDLASKEREVLKFLARARGDVTPNAWRIGEELKVTKIRATHFCETLVSRGLLTLTEDNFGEPIYPLTPEGRAYIVQNDLDVVD